MVSVNYAYWAEYCIDVQYHFIRDEYENKRILLAQIPTKENGADIFTKPLARILHSTGIKNLGLTEWNDTI